MRYNSFVNRGLGSTPPAPLTTIGREQTWMTPHPQKPLPHSLFMFCTLCRALREVWFSRWMISNVRRGSDLGQKWAQENWNTHIGDDRGWFFLRRQTSSKPAISGDVLPQAFRATWTSFKGLAHFISTGAASLPLPDVPLHHGNKPSETKSYVHHTQFPPGRLTSHYGSETFGWFA